MTNTGAFIWVTNPFNLGRTITDHMTGTWQEFAYHRVIVPSGDKWYFQSVRDYEIFQNLWWWSYEDYTYYKNEQDEEE
jgi:hypothetical protein